MSATDSTENPRRAAGCDAPRRAPRVLRGLIWLVAAGVLVGCVGPLVPTSTGAPTRRQVAAGPQLAGVLPADVSTPPARHLDFLSSGTRFIPDPSGNLRVVHAPGGLSKYDADPTELLPAYRWAGDVELTTNYGFWDKANPASSKNLRNFIAELLFSIASFFWSFCISLVVWASSLNVVVSGGRLINAGVYTLTSGLLRSGIVAAVGVWVFFAMFRHVAAGKAQRGVTTVLVFMFAIGTMTAMASRVDTKGELRAAPDADMIVETPVLPAGSPSWIAYKATSFIDSVGVAVASAGGLLSSSVNRAQSDTAVAEEPSCATYIEGLYNQYEAYTSAKDGTAPNPAYNNATTRVVPVTLSRLWERGYLQLWGRAQLGSSDAYNRIGCRLLEGMDNTRPSEQLVIQSVGDRLVGSGLPAQTPTLPGSGRGRGGIPYFPRDATGYPSLGNKELPLGWDGVIAALEKAHADDPTRIYWKGYNDKDTQNRLGGWLYCARSAGSWGPSSFVVGAYSGSATDASARRAEYNKWVPKACAEWWSKGKFPDNGGDRTHDFYLSMNDPELKVNAGMYEFKHAMNGYNLATRMTMSMMALLTSVVYLVALGGIALGLLGSQVALFALLLCLPVTLLALAIPGSDLGKRMLRLTAAMASTKLIFVVLLVVLSFMIAYGNMILRMVVSS